MMRKKNYCYSRNQRSVKQNDAENHWKGRFPVSIQQNRPRYILTMPGLNEGISEKGNPSKMKSLDTQLYKHDEEE